MLSKLSIFSLLFILFNSCGSENQNFKEEKVIRAMYHWKTNFNLSMEQNKLLADLKIKELYVHFFDIIWDGAEAVPTAVVNFESKTNLTIKPVVFITPAVFTNLDSSEIKVLAEKTTTKIKTLSVKNSITEIQIDCDWMPSIKDKYFFFMTEMKALSPDVLFSSTIRLYQYKYPDLAGVPPVDKGLLMYYNMGSLTDFKEDNSILSNREGKKYLGFNKYPLPLDIALPNFSWSLIFEDMKFQKISSDFDWKKLQNEELFVRLDRERYVFLKDTVINGTYYRYGTQLRYESCMKETLIEAANMLVKEMNQTSTRIIFYDLQEKTKNDYEKLDIVYSIFE